VPLVPRGRGGAGRHCATGCTAGSSSLLQT
jgi:hypothetical protein